MKKYYCVGCGERFELSFMSCRKNYCHVCNEFYSNMRIKELEKQLELRKKDAELIAESNSGLAKMVTDKDKQLVLVDKALEIACLVIARAMCPNGDWETLKIDFANAYKEEAKKELESEGERDKN